MRISKRVDGVAPSGIRAFFDLVLGMKDVISLGVGEPDFVTPWHVRARAIESLEQGFTSYTSNKGMIELRGAIAAFLKKRHRLDYDPEEEILITVGVSEALDLAMRSILNPGEKILVPEPYYVAYGPVVDLAGGETVFLKTSIDNGFKITPQQIEKAVVPGVRGLLLGYPSNPTGTSYSKKELEAICRVVKKHDLLVISDELYDELTYDFEHTPLSALPQMKNRVIYLNGFSKSYAMTGFRVGYVCGPADIVGAMTKIHQYTSLCAPITSQMAAIEAIKNSNGDVAAMKKEYDRRRRFIVGALNDIGLRCHMPQGAFYAFPSIASTGESAMDFARNLLKKQKVALVPGDAFGASCGGHVRISYASSYENLKEAVCRIEKYLKKR
ncbi:MAG: aminotransferase class I/II-fold pyridoxal phosphate-dependent enzyme [Candidatus Omnitrophica bacterium]|nr:aminotransferase class I/II-fold pyridoxal phosphate-dependent enzyme [Candidatus Omnitrophota bacterium]MDE2009470.1 aminotransferase class I/II-fold pyridoxal phosphate-dependent enzyme [Candidatus Omnitrophota bacterium]MDE2214681.1 aminotransferase class I/II-fold pyridoxal phosphate-dependent enzyme [Candidatus Omnitrophota bacterium]MDE2231995.1 aminotransferase class I/II-fold pyridoxal phosphate-dependent enzyme [Candidatus Omnitrophota bacterium]